MADVPKGIALVPGQSVIQPPQQPLPQAEEAKPQIGMLNVKWDKDPFLIPRIVGERRIEQPKVLLKLVAILENKKGRMAIIGNDIVGKGDFVGDEMVQEIGKDRVILVRKGQKRVLPVSSAVNESLTKNAPMEEKK